MPNNEVKPMYKLTSSFAMFSAIFGLFVDDKVMLTLGLGIVFSSWLLDTFEED